MLSRHMKHFSLARMDTAVRWVQVIVCVSAVILCLAKTDLHGTYDDSMDFKFKTWVLGAELTGIEYPVDMNKNAALYRIISSAFSWNTSLKYLESRFLRNQLISSIVIGGRL